MQYVLEQLITLYPQDNVIVAMESGNNASGRLGSLIPANNPYLLQLVNSHGAKQEAVNLCRIASIRINSSAYNQTINYLPVPAPAPTGCDANCEAAVRAYLPAGTKSASISSGGQTVAQGKVLRNEYGMLVIVGSNNSNPTFVSTCKVELSNK